MSALVAEVLGDRGGQRGAVQAHEWGVVGRGGHDDRASHPLLAKDALDELLDLASPLADETDHDHVGLREPRHHPEQTALADAAAREQPHALPATHREQGVDGPYPHVEGLVDAVPGQGVDAAARERDPLRHGDRSLAVQGHAGAREHATEHRVAEPHVAPPPDRRDAGVRGEPADVADGHQVEPVRPEPHHLGFHDGAPGAGDPAAITDRRLTPHGLQGQTHHPREHPLDHERGRSLRPLPAGREARGPQPSTVEVRGHARPRALPRAPGPPRRRDAAPRWRPRAKRRWRPGNHPA